MRKNYYILWLDDEFNDDNALALQELKKYVQEYVENTSYKPVITECLTIDEANKHYMNNKVDIFISDFNIGDRNGKTGLMFLEEVRKNNYKQDLVLYSKNTRQEIKSMVINYLNKPESDIKFFSRFTFESIHDPRNFCDTIEDVIYLNIQKWDELNALRGLYLSEISQFEHMVNALIDKNRNFFYNIIVRNCKELKMNQKKLLRIKYRTFGILHFFCVHHTNVLFNEWKEIASIRNSFAHVEESQDGKGVYILSLKDNKKKYYESDIFSLRMRLFNFLENAIKYINNL